MGAHEDGGFGGLEYQSKGAPSRISAEIEGTSCENTTRNVVGVDIAGFSLSAEMEGGVISESLCTFSFVATI